MSHPWGEPTICCLWPSLFVISSLTWAPDSGQRPFPRGLCQASSRSHSSQAPQPFLSPQPLLALPPAGPFLEGLPLKSRLTLSQASRARENI